MDLSAIKAQLEEAANEDYKQTLASTTIERPSEEDLFKENKSTAAVVEDVIKFDAEAEKVRNEYASASYTTDRSSSRTRRRQSTAVEAEVVKTSTPSWGYYGSYGSSSSTTTKVETQAEKERKEAMQQIDDLFEESIDQILDDVDDSYDVLSLHRESVALQKAADLSKEDASAYRKERNKLKLKAQLYKRLLSLCKIAVKTCKASTIMEKEY